MQCGRWLLVGCLAWGMVGASCSSSSSGRSADGTGGASGAPGEGGAGGQDASGPSVEELAPLLAATMCDIVDECLGALAPIFLGGADCLSEQTAGIADGDFGLLAAAVEAGRVAYHPEYVEPCLDAIADLSCEMFVSSYFEACEQALTGTVAEGGDCELDDECAGDLRCLIEGSCPGSCVERVGSGEPCDENDDCEVGLWCTEQAPYVCVNPAAEGEPCREGTQPCVPPLSCWGEDSANDVAGECVDLTALSTASEGELCNLLEGPWCRAGLFCDLAAGECTSERPGSGGNCVPMLPDQCPDGEWCDTTVEAPYACVPIPGDREPCTPKRFGARCQPSHACLEADGLCHALQRLGEACDVGGDCYSGNCEGGGCAPPDPCSGG